MTALRQRIAHRLLVLGGTPIGKDFPNASFPPWPLRVGGDGKGTASMEPGGHADPHDLAMVLRSPTDLIGTLERVIYVVMTTLLPDFAKTLPSESFVGGMQISWAAMGDAALVTVGVQSIVILAMACLIFQKRELARVQV